MNEKILSLGQKCLRILCAETKMASFLGGKPVVRSPIDWPRKNNKPLGFIAQLDLGEINLSRNIEWLPDSGRLLFFYDLEEWPWGFDPNDKGGWAVIYENGSGELYSQKLPGDLSEDHIAPSIKYVKAERFTSYPDAQ
ncbi:MAG: DUF1963 domain-containing protein, partial [Pararheinheimera sp.]|nr:DUF1963 domain-containing protein [Rheinheimera sp.]